MNPEFALRLVRRELDDQAEELEKVRKRLKNLEQVHHDLANRFQTQHAQLHAAEAFIAHCRQAHSLPDICCPSPVPVLTGGKSVSGY